ncbi:hypothetical protein Aperf_G00000123334 [Anoplocephala perfoliata]
MPETVLARTCLEASERLANLQPTLSHLLFGCGQAASQLAHARLNWGARVHENVISPMKRVADAAGPNSEMARIRRQAWRAGGELRAVSERAARAANSLADSQGSSVDEIQAPKTKVIPEGSSSPVTNSGRKDGSSGSKLQPAKSILKSVPMPINRANHNLASGTSMAKGSPSGAVVGIASGEGSIVKTAKATQLNAIKEDLEAESQLLKEKALRELFNFETTSMWECSQALVEMVEISAAYHRSCAAILEELAPLIRAELEEQCPLPVYGRNLETHLAVTRSKIAYPLRCCVRILNTPAALREEGLFRIAGSKNKVDTLKSALNTLRAENLIGQYDYYVVADAMKQYLRSLPQPLLTSHLLNEWTQALQIKDKAVQLLRLQQVAQRMPPDYERNAGYLFHYLHRLIEHTEQNRMTPANLAIIFEPSLFNPPSSSTSSSPNSDDHPAVVTTEGNSVPSEQNGYTMPPQLAFQGAYRGLIELLIIHANEIFPAHHDEDNDDDDDNLEDTFDDVDENEEFTQTSISLASEPLVSITPSRVPTPTDILSKRAARAMNEFARQSRAIKNLPQRLRSKRVKPPDSRSHAVTSISIAKSAPVPGRSLTPVPIRKDLESTPRLDRTRSLTQEEISIMEEAEEEEEEEVIVEERIPSPPNRQSPRSILQHQHMEWRRAMLEVAEADSSTGEQKSSIHGDLYDTLFTIQTLNNNNSKIGVEELLARFRSVYESRSIMGKSSITTSAKNGGSSGTAVDSAAVSSDSKPATKIGARMVRRHSTSSLSMLDRNKTVATFIKPIQAVKGYGAMMPTTYRKKCSTTPGPLNGRILQRVTIPLFANAYQEGKKRPISSISHPQRYSVNDSTETPHSNVKSAASLVVMPSSSGTTELELSRPSKRTTLPRTGIDVNSTTCERRKVISASVTTSDYHNISLQDKFCSPLTPDLDQD